jgi:hypothetical protein
LAEVASPPSFYAASCAVLVPVTFGTNLIDDLNPFSPAKNAASIKITPAIQAKSSKEKVAAVKATLANLASADATRTDAEKAQAQKEATAAANDAKETKSALTAATYTDEAPSLFGASFALPVTSYKELNVDQSAGTVIPKSVTRQSLYFTLDLYVPRVEPPLMHLRYLPHVFVGVPFSGKPLKRPMGGVAVSLKYFEVFYGAVYDMENKNAAGAQDAVWKSVFGVKLPIGSTAKMLGAK